MSHRASPIIKKQHVRPGPARPLAGAAGSNASRPGPSAAPAAEPQVRIARIDADRALLEVQCACGNVITVECQWNPSPAKGQESPAGAPSDPNQEASS